MTEKDKHTPGPWRLHDVERATIVAGKPGGEVANCCNGFGDQDANARLIAATPDLLAALKQLTFAARTSGGTAGRDEALCVACDMAEAAIAEAETHPRQTQDADLCV